MIEHDIPVQDPLRPIVGYHSVSEIPEWRKDPGSLKTGSQGLRRSRTTPEDASSPRPSGLMLIYIVPGDLQTVNTINGRTYNNNLYYDLNGNNLNGIIAGITAGFVIESVFSSYDWNDRSLPIRNRRRVKMRLT